MKIIYTNGTWRIKKRDDMYRIYNGTKYIDESESFDEAYDMLVKDMKETLNEK